MDRLWRPVGDRPTHVLFAGYGLAVLLFALKTWASAEPAHLVAPGAWVLHGLAAAAAIVLLGPRPVLLLLATALTARAIVSNHVASEPLLWFPAAEWPVFFALPATGLLALLHPTTQERFVRSGFRLASAAAIGFAGLHKLNTDFFDPVVTCNRFSARLSEWWAFPEALHAWVSPGVVVTLELGAPFVLLLAPRLGVVLTLLLLLQFTGIGATALSLVLAVTALAWLDREDLDALEGREWLVALAGLPAFLASALLYRGPWSWPQYGLTHATFGALLAFATWRLLARGPGRPTSPFDGGRPVLVGLAVLWLANGLAPYTGLKFQYSFAMLSNLRVDDDRQNSLIFPDTLRIGPDPYVRVDRVTYLSARGRPLTGGAVHPGMYAPHELVRQRDIARTVDETLTFTGTWRGEPVTEADLDRLPPSPLFQKELTRGGPQECVH